MGKKAGKSLISQRLSDSKGLRRLKGLAFCNVQAGDPCRMQWRVRIFLILVHSPDAA